MLSKICAVIVSYHPDDKLISNIQAIYHQVNEILIVDNGSGKDALSIFDKINKEFEKVYILYNETNMGIGHALNQGVVYSLKKECDWLLTLDQDSECSIDYTKNMISEYISLQNNIKESVSIIVPTWIDRNLPEQQSVKAENTFELSAITSGSMIKLDLFKFIGVFEDKLFIDNVDHEFCLRCNLNGFKILKISSSILYHHLGNSEIINFLGKRVVVTNHNSLRRYYMTRNKLYIWKTYKKVFPKWVRDSRVYYTKDIIKMILFERERLAKIKMTVLGVVDFYRNKFGRFEK